MIEPIRLSGPDIADAAARGALADHYGPLIVATSPIPRQALGAEPCIVLGVDVLTIDEAQDRRMVSPIIATANTMPTASVAACVLLRATSEITDADARLVLESTTYSTLQSGPEFARWRASREPKQTATADSDTDLPAVLVDRIADTLHLRLNRPTHGNAVNRSLRDALAEAVHLALVDETITNVILDGDGNHFCTGGDLDEFGSFTSPAEAHLIRLQRSPARLLARLADRLTVHVRGNCAGSGVELAAFASRVVADPATTFRLPEIALGLVPGAGGTVSIVDRIGPERTLRLLLTDERIDAPTALAWGLVDEISAR